MHKPLAIVLSSGTPDETDLLLAQIKAAAEVLLEDYGQEWDNSHLTWDDFVQPAMRVVKAVRDAQG